MHWSRAMPIFMPGTTIGQRIHFEVAYHIHGNMNWGGNSHDDGKIWYGYMCAAPEYGGWGSLALSWEYYRSFEQGDKRKEYTCVGTGDVHPITNENWVPIPLTADMYKALKMYLVYIH